MRIEATTDASMQEVMTSLLGYKPLELKTGSESKITIRSDFKSDHPVSIVPTHTNSERQIKIPILIIELNAKATAIFDYTVGQDGNFAFPVGGKFKIVLE